jgi:hypothetical protein
MLFDDNQESTGAAETQPTEAPAETTTPGEPEPETAS